MACRSNAEAAIKRAIREFSITEPERQKRLAAYRGGLVVPARVSNHKSR